MSLSCSYHCHVKDYTNKLFFIVVLVLYVAVRFTRPLKEGRKVHFQRVAAVLLVGRVRQRERVNGRKLAAMY